MEILKTFFPYSFKEKKDVTALVINIIVYVVIGFVAGALIGILNIVPIVNILVGIVCGAIDLYVLIAIVLSILDYLKIIK